MGDHNLPLGSMPAPDKDFAPGDRLNHGRGNEVLQIRRGWFQEVGNHGVKTKLPLRLMLCYSAMQRE
jgi:hypothetical protein